MKDPYDLTGRVALITGASSYGIGSQSARLIAEHGAKVFLTARREDKLREVCEEIISSGGDASYMAIDVADEDQCARAVAKCIDDFGRLDIMVLSAGISGVSASGGMDAIFDSDNWRNIQSINLDGVFYMVKHGWKHCAEHGVGAIVPVSSLAALRYNGSLAYTASKGAIRSMTHYLGALLAPEGVRVNTFYPGVIDTDMTHGAVTYQAWADGQLKKIPIGHFGTVEDSANAVLFLVSDASSYMVGQHLVVDGGESC